MVTMVSVVSRFRLKAPPGISSSCISPLTSSGQRSRAPWASQPQKSATLSPQPGGWHWGGGNTDRVTLEINTETRIDLYVVFFILSCLQRSGYGLDCPGFESRPGKEIFLFSETPRLARGAHPASCPMRNGDLSWVGGGKAAGA